MSKLVQTSEKLARKVAEGYKKIEDGVVGGYKKIESGAVEGFGKVVDKCVEVLFAREGESVEDTKKRLNHKEEMYMKDQEFIIQKIRTQYTEKEHTELDALKELDAKVKKPAKCVCLHLRLPKRHHHGRGHEPCYDRHRRQDRPCGHHGSRHCHWHCGPGHGTVYLPHLQARAQFPQEKVCPDDHGA